VEDFRRGAAAKAGNRKSKGEGSAAENFSVRSEIPHFQPHVSNDSMRPPDWVDRKT